MTDPSPVRVRSSELMACFAAATELAMGQNADHAMQGCAVAVHLARAAGLQGSDLRNTYFLALLRFVGCNAETAVIAELAGDVQALRRAMALLDSTHLPQVVAALVDNIRSSHAQESGLQVLAAVLRGLGQSGRLEQEVLPGHCEVAQRLGRRLGFDERFVSGLGQLYARWDGKGIPATAGEAIMPAARVVALAQDMVLHGRQGGWPAVQTLIAQRTGGQFDPALCALALREGEAWLHALPLSWDEVFALEPPPHDWLSGQSLHAAVDVLADHADVQSHWLMGHSRRVARIAVDAARQLGLPQDRQALLSMAARVHDLGRVGVSTDVWERAGPWTQSERDRARMHAAWTAQILTRAPALAGLARLAASAHERADGSGYPRQIGAAQLPDLADLLAAADVAAALGEARPHRPALASADIETVLQGEVRAGHLSAPACNAVLQALGSTARAAPAAAPLPAGLGEREAQVLRELARGQTNKQIARRLGVSPKTVGHQVQAVYRKLGVNTRAGATLAALEHGLLSAD